MKQVILSVTALLVALGFGASTFGQETAPAPTAQAQTAPTPGEMKAEGSPKMDRAAKKAERKAAKDRHKAERKAEKAKRKAEKKSAQEAPGAGGDTSKP